MIWFIPDIVDDRTALTRFGRLLTGSWVGAVRIDPAPWAELNMCHHNSATICAYQGGTVVRGYYVLRFLDGIEFQAISHSIWRSPDGELIDVTPTPDDRPFNIFIEAREAPPDRARKSLISLDKYGIDHEITMPFYVYMLVDPRTGLPFYIGKGTGNRAVTHLWNISRTHNVFKENTIRAIRKAGAEPLIEYVAEDLADEDVAYELEASLIRKYGRKGYDEGGILTNVCEDARPPCHRGKTYEQIYGSAERAQEQIDKRRAIQIARGGFGPKQHSDETRAKLSERHSRHMLGKNHRPETIEKIRANRTPRRGSNHPLTRPLIIISPSGEETKLYGRGELQRYCQRHNLGFAQFAKQLNYGRPPAKRGRNVGWKIMFENP